MRYPYFRPKNRLPFSSWDRRVPKEWPRIARILETVDSFPPIDEHLGARYWPAVVGYFHNRWNVDLYKGPCPDCPEAAGDQINAGTIDENI